MTNGNYKPSTNTEGQKQERPWTPGPWHVHAGRYVMGGGEQMRSHVAQTREDQHLKALAPEMAEAILAHYGDCSDDGETMYPDGCEHSCMYGEDYQCKAHEAADAALKAVFDKLRAMEQEWRAREAEDAKWRAENLMGWSGNV